MRQRVAWLSHLLVLGLLSCGESSEKPEGNRADAAMLSASTDTQNGSSLGREACSALTGNALKLINDAVSSVKNQCAVDTECKVINLAVDCWPSCQTAFLSGNSAVQSAVDAQSRPIAEVCAQFRKGGCVVVEPGCPNLSGKLTCQAQQCVVQP